MKKYVWPEPKRPATRATGKQQMTVNRLLGERIVSFDLKDYVTGRMRDRMGYHEAECIVRFLEAAPRFGSRLPSQRDE